VCGTDWSWNSQYCAVDRFMVLRNRSTGFCGTFQQYKPWRIPSTELGFLSYNLFNIRQIVEICFIFVELCDIYLLSFERVVVTVSPYWCVRGPELRVTTLIQCHNDRLPLIVQAMSIK
jgi:hypothetical protein